jgi:DNA-binding Lrp family transcriptional regulator
LQQNPVAPAVALAKETGVSPPTVRAWLESLRSEEVYWGVQAIVKARRLGLELDDFLVTVESFDSVQRIEQFCEEHPYTSYRARVFGGNTHGILLQFRQPDAARKHLLEALNLMKKNGLITGIRELPSLSNEYGSTHTRPRLNAWDADKEMWVFDWEKWWKKASATRGEPSAPIDDQSRVKIDGLDAKLIEEITKDARRKNIEIIQRVGLDKDQTGIQQDISKRIRRLEEELIDTYRVFINWAHFDVYNTPLIIAKADEQTSSRLVSRLSEGEFPFASTIRQTPQGFVWSAQLPSAHLSELVSLVWRLCDSYELLILDYKHTQIYGLWAETFDIKTGDWRTDRKFCLEDPLKKIGIPC